jgi:ubiquinone/menaquinone biosynthesis C-methylase UbiE
MGFYAQHIFPRVMDWAMRSPRLHDYRRAALAPAHGRVLEIGFGTGLNLAHYPREVTALTAVEPAVVLPGRVRQRQAAAPFPIERIQAGAEHLPLPDAGFDYVVSTFTLCSIPDVAAALKEVRRVLTAEGRFLFLEHGRSDDARVARWQDRLTPIQRVLACGCHLNRRIDRVIDESGLHVTHLDRFLLPGVPRIAGEIYQGIAQKK